MKMKWQNTEGIGDGKPFLLKGRGIIPLLVFISIFDAYLILYKLHLGLPMDEVGNIATADMFLRGAQPLKDNWFALQFNAIFIMPFEMIYKGLTGSTEGIVLYFRILFIIIQSIFAVFAFRELTFHLPYRYAYLGTAILYAYVPYMYSLTYKTLSSIFLISGILLLLSFKRRPSLFRCFLLGAVIFLSSLVYVTTAIMIVPFAIALWYMTAKEKTGKSGTLKYELLLTGTFFAAVLLFSLSMVFRMGVSGVAEGIRHILGDETHQDSLIIRLARLMIPAAGACAAGGAVFWLHRKLKKITADMFLLIFFIAAAALLFFLKTDTLNVSRLNYLFLLVFGLDIFLLWEIPEKRLFYLTVFLIPSAFWMLSIMLATNQGIEVVACGCLPAAVLFIFLASENRLSLHKSAAFIAGLTVLAGLILVPVNANVTNTTVFAESARVSEGSAKGIDPLDFQNAEKISDISEMVKKYVSSGDSLLILACDKDAVGYLDGEEKTYATFSPAWIVSPVSDRLVKFYQENPDRRPTAAIVELDGLPVPLDEYLNGYAIGQYLKENAVQIEETGNYAYIRLN